jgi:hypothetical protein
LNFAVADELEAQLTVVNQQPSLRQSTDTSKPKQRSGGERMEKQIKKSESEKVRRDEERLQLARISRLFRAPRGLWSKKDVLSLGKTKFLIN